MRPIDPAVIAALQTGRIVERRLIWITAKDRDTGDPQPVGFWSDVGSVTAPVVDALSGATVSRDFHAGLASIGTIRLATGLTVREVTASFAANVATVELAFRGYDPKRAAVQIYRGLFDPATRSLIEAAESRFAGFIDRVDFNRGAEGEVSSVEVTLVSHARELTRINTETRSDESQKARTGGADRFYRHAGVAHKWKMFWGEAKPKVGKGGPPKRGRRR